MIEDDGGFFLVSPPVSSATNWSQIALTGKVPATARYIALTGHVQMGGAFEMYWGEDAYFAGKGVATKSNTFVEHNIGDIAGSSLHFELPIVGATPAIQFVTAGGGSNSVHRLRIAGWRS